MPKAGRARHPKLRSDQTPPELTCQPDFSPWVTQEAHIQGFHLTLTQNLRYTDTLRTFLLDTLHTCFDHPTPSRAT